MADTKNYQQMIEKLFAAYEIVGQRQLDGMQFDKTITCTIVDDSNAEKGEYRVSDGSSSFLAYSETTTYTNGTYVYVTIPNGDFNNQKLIKGKYVNNNTEHYTYVSPMRTFIDITKNLIETSETDSASLLANGDESQVLLWRLTGVSHKGYDRLGLKADFRSWLNSFKTVAGNYGLRLDIVSEEPQTSTTAPVHKVYSVTLDTTDMYGDPYNYETYYNQEKIVDIKEITNIIEMRLYFFQDKDFTAVNGAAIPYLDSEGELLMNNLFIKNPWISLGYDLSNFTEDTLLLYTLDPITYNAYLTDEQKAQIIEELDRNEFESEEAYTQHVNNILYDPITASTYVTENNVKTIQARWIHLLKDGTAEAIDTTEGIPEGAVLHWYKYRLVEGLADDLAGPFWEEITSLKNKFICEEYHPDITAQYEYLKLIVEIPSREIQAEVIYNTNCLSEFYEENYLSKQTFMERITPAIDAARAELSKLEAFVGDEDAQVAKAQELYNQCTDEIAGLDTNDPDYNSKCEDLRNIYNSKIMNMVTDAQAEISTISLILDEVAQHQAITTYYESEKLELENENEVSNKSTLDLIQGLTITCDEGGHKGVYRIYNDDGEIMSGNEAMKKRILSASYSSLVTGDENLDSVEEIEWWFPKNNTMVQFPEEEKEYSCYDKVEGLTAVTYLTDGTYYIKTSSGYEKSTSAFKSNEVYYKRNNTFIDDSDPDYFIIKRQGVKLENVEAGTEVPQSADQVFRIKSRYNENLVNNTIYCRVVKNKCEYLAEAILTFGPCGTNGTDYTFTLELENKAPAITVSSNVANAVYVIPKIYDYQNKDVTSLYLDKISYSWYSEGNGGITLGTTKREDGAIALIPNSDDISDYRFYILKAKALNASKVGEKEVSLITHLPIAVRKDNTITAFEGATKIIYSSSGTNPKTNSFDAYKLYKWSETDKKTIAYTGVSWNVELGADTIAKKTGTTSTAFYPSMKTDNTLILPSMYLQENGKQIAVEGTSGNSIIWTQPIHIYQNAYSSALLNAWDGSFSLNEENGTLLSAMIGAGKKDDLNRFNGVLMGDVKSSADSTVNEIGLYGYHEGIQSFGFKIDGTAFIGKSGKGQILFDGNSGTIQSASYKLKDENNKVTGTKIDLDDGQIDLFGAVLTGIKVRASGEKVSVEDALQMQIDDFNTEKSNLEDEKQLKSNTITEYQNEIISLQEELEHALTVEVVNLEREAQAADTLTEQELALVKEYEAKKMQAEQDLLESKKVLAKALKDAKADNQDDYLKVLEAEKLIALAELEYEIILRQQELDEELLRCGEAQYEVERIRDMQKILEMQVEQFNSEIQNREDFISNCQGYITELNGEIEKVDEKLISYQAMLTSYQEAMAMSDEEVSPTEKYELTAEVAKAFCNTTDYTPVYTSNQAHVHLGVTTPYFFIESEDANKLIYIGNDEYYLKTNDYEARQDDNPINYPGAGMYLNLDKGFLKAYDFALEAYDTESESFVKLSSDGRPYLQIHHQDPTSDSPVEVAGQDMLYIGDGKYVLQSSNYKEHSGDYDSGTYEHGAGIHFNLKKGEIKAYDFHLKAYSTDEDSPGAYLEIDTDGSPYFKIHHVATGTNGSVVEDLDILNISHSKFVMRSMNFVDGDDDVGSGTEFDLTKGRILSYDFSILAYNPDVGAEKEGLFKIDSGAKKTPLSIGEHFSVDWDGEVYASKIHATSGGTIGPFTISETALYTGSSSIGGSGVYLGSDGLSVANGLFTVYASASEGSYAAVLDGNMKIDGSLDIMADTYITGNLWVQGMSYLEGGLTVQGKGYVGGSGYSGGTSGGGWGFNGSSGHVGPWIIDETGIYTGSVDSPISFLGASGELKLSNGNNTLQLTSAAGLVLKSQDGETFTVNGGLKYENGKGVFQVDDTYAKIGIAASGNALLTMSSGSVWLSASGSGSGASVGYLQLSSSGTGAKLVGGGGGSGCRLELSSDEAVLGVNGSTTAITLSSASCEIAANSSAKLSLSSDNITIDGYTCKKDQTVNIRWIFSTSTKLKFHKGLLVNEDLGDEDPTTEAIDLDVPLNVKGTISAYEPGTSTLSPLGKLAFLDEVVIDKANFKMGAGTLASLGTPTSTIDGDTATYTISLPSSTYYKKASGENTYYKGDTAGYYQYSGTRYIYSDGSTGSSSTAPSGLTRTGSYSTYSYVTVNTRGDSVKVPNYTEMTEFEATITVKAQKAST